MLYTNGMIKQLGFKSVDEFVADFVSKHPNCIIHYRFDGVYCDYDLDSEPGINNAGTIMQ